MTQGGENCHVLKHLCGLSSDLIDVSALTGEPDAELVARCQRGEAAAWRALVRRYQRPVYAVGRRAGLQGLDSVDQPTR